MTNMGLAKTENIKMYSFVVIAVLSVLTLWGPTNNYVQFFKAVEKLNITASKSPITFMPNYRALITVSVSIENPTGYSGIGIVSVMFQLSYIRANGTVEELSRGSRIWFKDEPGEPLDPHSVVAKSYDLVLNLENKRNTFEELQNLQNSDQKIETSMDDVQIDINVFMGRVPVPAETILLQDD
jgi:hypothetical protein